MSFILDALKKSESDRQRQSGPSLFEVKVAPPRRTLPVWAVAIAVLLVVNVIVISWMLLRHPAAQQQPAAAATPPPATITAPGNRSAGQDTAPTPSVAAAQPQGSTAAAPAASPAPRPAATAAPPAAAGAASTSQPAAATPTESGAEQSAAQSASQAAAGSDSSDYAPAVEPSGGEGSVRAAGPTDGLPLYQQIVSSAGLPDLHLDLHVFANRPQDRFAMINMHRVAEGDTLPSGAHVEVIRPDGVVLSYHGTRFLLPRN